MRLEPLREALRELKRAEDALSELSGEEYPPDQRKALLETLDKAIELDQQHLG